MKNPKQKLIVILGQTATGKSAFAVTLAKKVGGEIISADSRQVYKGLDIGTGKITTREMRGVPHHLLDIVSPKKIFSVSDFTSKAISTMVEIKQRGNVPIIVGGTGFYIDALINGNTLPEVPPNMKLRKILERKSASALFRILQKLDPRRAKEIDQHNPIRLIRAIEIIKALGKVPKQKSVRPKYDTLKIGLALPERELKRRIHTRLFARIRGGMIAEAKRLHKEGLSWKRMEALGLEYRYLAKYLQKKLTKKEMLEQLEK